MTNSTTSWAVEASLTVITTAVAAKRNADKKLDTAIDVLWANGARCTDMLSPDSKKERKDGRVSTATKEDYAAARAAVVAGFTKAIQQLLDKPTKSLEDIDKSTKRYWQQQIGARLGDFQTGLDKRETAANPEAVTTKPKVTKAAIERLGDAIDTAEKILQGDGTFPDWFDLPEATAVIKAFRNKYKVPSKSKPVSIDAIV